MKKVSLELTESQLSDLFEMVTSAKRYYRKQANRIGTIEEPRILEFITLAEKSRKMQLKISNAQREFNQDIIWNG